MPKLVNHAGKRFGRWTVLDYCNNSLWRCCCDCGNEKNIKARYLTSGNSQSCGCLRNERVKAASWRMTIHGESRLGGKGTKEYRTWQGVIRRCTSPKKKYRNYSGRGIKICKHWRISFKNFLADVGRAPSTRHSIDRINVDGDYEPGNVCWSTPFDQVHNRRKYKDAKSAKSSGVLSFGS